MPALQSGTYPPTALSPLEISPTSLTLERRTLNFGSTGDQLTQVQNQVMLLENHLAAQSRDASQYLQHQQGQSQEAMLAYRTEFETQAQSYEMMAREVALTELQQQRNNMSADHSAQLDRISLHVRHEEAQAQYNLQQIDQRLAASTAYANDAAARATAALQANRHLEEELLRTRAAVESPERRCTDAVRANAVIRETAMNFDEVRRHEIEVEAQLKHQYYQEAIAGEHSAQRNADLYIQERKNNIALGEKVKQLEIHLKDITDKTGPPLDSPAGRSSSPTVKDTAEFALMKKRLEKYEEEMADMAAQSEVDRQTYAHKLSELQRERPAEPKVGTETRSPFAPFTGPPSLGIGRSSAWVDGTGDSPRSTRPMMAEDEGVSSDDTSSVTTSKDKKKVKITIKEADSITFSALPPPQKFRQWRLAFKEEITSASSDPDLALRWLGDIERAKN